MEADYVIEAKDHIIRVDRCVSTFPNVPNGKGRDTIGATMIVWITEGSKVKAAKTVLDSLAATPLNCPRSRRKSRPGPDEDVSTVRRTLRGGGPLPDENEVGSTLVQRLPIEEIHCTPGGKS